MRCGIWVEKGGLTGINRSRENPCAGTYRLCCCGFTGLS